jgi:formylglycine-generating enzyme required for sulfatase activity
MKRSIFLCSIFALSFAAPCCSSTAPAVLDEIYANMVSVKGGTFTMGNSDRDAYSWEKPAHRVTVDNFQISKYLVTQKQWQEVMDDNPSRYQGDDLPVENVSWEDVQQFIQKLNDLTGRAYRLPTEAEWEFAARGGVNSRNYKYAGSYNINDVAWYARNSGNQTKPVGTAKSSNELGLYDMSGNVWEWCNDWFGSYTGAAQTNPKGPETGTARVFRGGSWYYDARSCYVSYRSSAGPDLKNNNIGFRLCL